MTRADFNDLVKQLSRKLFGYAFRILRNQEEAEDAVQEIFIRLWKMEDKLADYASIDAMAITMTKNLCIDIIRKKKHFNFSDTSAGELKLSDNASPFELLQNKQSDEILNHIIGNLPEIYRSVIRMKEIEGLSYEEIAENTKQNINTLRVTLSRARKLIRDEFNRYHYERTGITKAHRKVL
jgi:RNA polymerase sigma-70 factor, ECF subfamily